MNAIDIILILIGITIIIISCRLVDDTKGGMNRELKPNTEELEQKKLELEELLNQYSEELIEGTEDELSRLSNEKIIAVSEYSEQILEKINHNHEEVVFLYHMLSEKENSLKKMVGDMDHKTVMPSADSEHTNNGKPEEEKSWNEAQQLNLQVKYSKMTNQSEINNAESEVHKPVDEVGNNNEKILKLYSKGKSIVEISKLLEIGQGEVKLVIDLYRGRK